MFIVAGMGFYYYFYFDIGSKAFRQNDDISDEEYNDSINENDDDGIVDGENNEGDEPVLNRMTMKK